MQVRYQLRHSPELCPLGLTSPPEQLVNTKPQQCEIGNRTLLAFRTDEVRSIARPHLPPLLPSAVAAKHNEPLH